MPTSSDGLAYATVHSAWASVRLSTTLAAANRPATWWRNGVQISPPIPSGDWYDHYPPLNTTLQYQVANAAGIKSTVTTVTVNGPSQNRVWLKAQNPQLSMLVRAQPWEDWTRPRDIGQYETLSSTYMPHITFRKGRGGRKAKIPIWLDDKSSLDSMWAITSDRLSYWQFPPGMYWGGDGWFAPTDVSPSRLGNMDTSGVYSVDISVIEQPAPRLTKVNPAMTPARVTINDAMALASTITAGRARWAKINDVWKSVIP